MDGALGAGLQLLGTWQYTMTAESAPALLFDEWFRGELRDRLYRQALALHVCADRLDDAVARVLPDESVVGDVTVEMLLIERGLADPGRLRRMLCETLGQAVRRLRDQCGRDETKWRYGSSRRTRLTHAACALGLHGGSRPWSLGADPKSGSPETVGVAVFDPRSREQVLGASFRVVMDVGAWDQCVAVNTPGQSGDPRSAHFSDLYEVWYEDRYVELSYSAARVAGNAETVLALAPPTAQGAP